MNDRLQRVVDEHEIDRVVTAWGFARDHGDWEVLRNCFHDDATIHISWYSGPAAEFVERSKTMVAEIKPGEHGKHQIGRAGIQVRGSRAISECNVELMRRVVGEEFEFDTLTWGRFIDLFEKRADGVWRIKKRTMVYEKDRLDPLNPAEVPAGFFESMDLSGFPPECRFLCFRLSLGGRAPMPDIVRNRSAEETQLKIEARDWLNG